MTINMYPKSKRVIINSMIRFLGAVICLAVLATAGLAQTTGSATLRGSIKDPQGAIIRGATVTLTSERTKDERKTTSSD
ncbi:MAG TPA: carboxypeptidase-like regulatory domain-containing protein, partial [Pyrinomonadaceae bacterium]